MERQQKQIEAARRSPPAPPNCSPLPETANLQLPGGALADVRIFSFGETRIYVPAEWLKLQDRTPDEEVGAYDPDVHRTECPGVVHQVTDGGILLGRFAGVYLDPGGRGKPMA